MGIPFLQTITGAEYDQFDQQVEECRKQLQQTQEGLDLKHNQEVERLKKEIQSLREDRTKLHSVTSSSASVTIYPPSTPSSEGVQSKEASLSGSPDVAQRNEEAKPSVDADVDEKKEEVGGSGDNVEEEEQTVQTATEVPATE